ncbi:MAG: glucosaminidase domain-containing protein [Myxococcota bacterium]|nr:glucosaminidase domain-containing protein [Myxococcota bacterium]
MVCLSTLLCLLIQFDVLAGETVCSLEGPPAKTLDSAQGLYVFFSEHGGSLESLRESARVPSIQIDRLPSDLNDLPAQRVDLFLRILLPSALQVNRGLAADRARLLSLGPAAERPKKDREFVEALSKRYGAPAEPISGLLERVDEVPVSLVLAQAAEESGWGRSRFAIEGNALFGQHTSNPNQPFMLARGADVRLAKFENICHAARAYMENLNGARAYAGLRALRARLRADGRPVTGAELAGELLAYSARGADYVRELRAIIRGHRLDDFDDAVLEGKPEWARVVSAGR